MPSLQLLRPLALRNHLRPQALQELELQHTRQLRNPHLSTGIAMLTCSPGPHVVTLNPPVALSFSRIWNACSSNTRTSSPFVGFDRSIELSQFPASFQMFLTAVLGFSELLTCAKDRRWRWRACRRTSATVAQRKICGLPQIRDGTLSEQTASRTLSSAGCGSSAGCCRCAGGSRRRLGCRGRRRVGCRRWAWLRRGFACRCVGGRACAERGRWGPRPRGCRSGRC